ncbi:MAG: hypothetical protein H0T70_03290 [Acidimicrobiia bacterium]|nr:hypothetical protein [Acidimicrobiia bacterium]
MTLAPRRPNPARRRPARLVLAAGAIALVAVTGACSGGSDDGAATLPTAPTTASTTPPPTTEPSTTVVSSVETTTPPPPTSSSSPEAQARALYDAWTRGDRAAAVTLAEPEAVTMLFARTWQAGDGWTFAECSGAAGSVICAWNGPSEQLLLRVQSGSGDQPVTVSEIRFV